MLKATLISSLDKVFLDSKLSTLEPLRSTNVYRGSTFSFQIAMTETACDAAHRRFVGISVEGIDKSAIEFRTVELIPSYMPVYPTRYDTEYVRTTPGLYPDLLQPLQMEGRVPCVMGQTRTVWVDIDASALSDGAHEIVVNIIDFSSHTSKARNSIYFLSCIFTKSFCLKHHFFSIFGKLISCTVQ